MLLIMIKNDKIQLINTIDWSLKSCCNVIKYKISSHIFKNIKIEWNNKKYYIDIYTYFPSNLYKKKKNTNILSYC